MPENPLYEELGTHVNPLWCYECDTWIPAHVPFWVRTTTGVCLCESCHAIAENN